MADLASFSLSDRRAAPHSRAHQYRLTAVSATWHGQTAGHAGGREGGREGGRGGRGGKGGEGRGGEGRGGEGRGEGRAGQGRAGEGRGRAGQGRAGQGRGGEGRGGDCPHFPVNNKHEIRPQQKNAKITDSATVSLKISTTYLTKKR